MKYLYLFIAAVLVIVLSFCTGEKETQTNQSSNAAISKRLQERDLFNTDSVLYAMATAQLGQKDEGRRCFLKAMDLLVNKKKPSESIALFREALMYFPDKRAYFYLASAYIQLNDAANAQSANDVCAELEYEPLYAVFYNRALISAIRKDTTVCIEELSIAVEEGFLNKKSIVSEPRFDFLRDKPEFISLMVNTFNDDAKLKALLFRNYLKAFPDLALPYTEPIDSVRSYSFPYISYDYAAFIPNMEGGRFSRDVTNEYYAVGKMKMGYHYAMVYKTYLALADTLNPVRTYVITYDSVGTVVDQEMIGCFCSPQEAKAYTIASDYRINLLPYTYQWKSDPTDKGYAGNEVLSVQAATPVQIQLENNGTITREKMASQSLPVPGSGG